MKLVSPLDTIKALTCCNCGSDTWMVDSDGAGSFWLLCIDPYKRSCMTTVELPAEIRVIPKPTEQ